MRDTRHLRGDCFGMFFVDQPFSLFALHSRHWGSTRGGCFSRCLAGNLEPVSLNFCKRDTGNTRGYCIRDVWREKLKLSKHREIHAVVALEVYARTRGIVYLELELDEPAL